GRVTEGGRSLPLPRVSSQSARMERVPSPKEGPHMKKSAVVLAVALLVAALGVSSAAFAQSSGNFTYGSNGGSTHCQLSSNGSITGGQICENNCTLDSTGNVVCSGNGTGSDLCVGSLNAGIKTNSGNGNVFVIRPSAVVGLLTDVSLVKNSVADIGPS